MIRIREECENNALRFWEQFMPQGRQAWKGYGGMKNEIGKYARRMLLPSIYAGFMIGIGGIIYLSCDHKVIGSLLFSFGLLTIVTQGFYLYTGKIGFVSKVGELPDMLVIVLGNFAGTWIVAFLCHMARLNIDSTELVRNKMNRGLGSVFVLSLFCGVMMYLAIDNYQKNQQVVFIIAPVMIFILAGFEHSVANMFYFHLAGAYSGKAFLYLIVMVVGNGVGAKLFGQCKPNALRQAAGHDGTSDS